MYSKGICSQSKLTPRKPKHRNVIVSQDLCSLSRLDRVLQIPCLPLKAVKFLALLGATKALTMKTCMLHSCWVCSLADWNKSTTRGVNFPHLTHLGALVCEEPSQNFEAISKSCLCPVPKEPAAAAIWENICKAPLSPERKIPFLISLHTGNSTSSANVNYSNCSQDRVPLLTEEHVQTPRWNLGPAVLCTVQTPAPWSLQLAQSKVYLREDKGKKHM